MTGCKFRQSAILAVLGLVAAPVASAREDVVPGSRYTSGRAEALGDAFLPLAEGGSASLFYNPAGIAKNRGPSLELGNLRVYGNSGLTGLFETTTLLKVHSLSMYAPTLTSNVGTRVGMGAALCPSFSTQGFSLGVLINDELSGEGTSATEVRYRSRYQIIPAVGFGVRLAGGIVRIGYSFQWVNQASGTVTESASADPLGYNQKITSGSAMSHNLGYALTLPYAGLPSLNAVVRNILGARYTTGSVFPLGMNTTGYPPDELMSVDVSLSAQPKLGATTPLNIVAQVRDATGTSGAGYLKRAAIGMELSLGGKFDLRMGYGSGYPTAGIGLRTKKGELNLAWTSEDVGTAAVPVQDTRYSLHFVVRAF